MNSGRMSFGDFMKAVTALTNDSSNRCVINVTLPEGDILDIEVQDVIVSQIENGKINICYQTEGHLSFNVDEDNIKIIEEDDRIYYIIKDGKYSVSFCFDIVKDMWE